VLALVEARHPLLESTSVRQAAEAEHTRALDPHHDDSPVTQSMPRRP
jgi:hypothetical protein